MPNNTAIVDWSPDSQFLAFSRGPDSGRDRTAAFEQALNRLAERKTDNPYAAVLEFDSS